MSSPENLPHIDFRIGPERVYRATPENATLFTFLGKTAIGDIEIDNSSVDHIYIQVEDDNGNTTGAYIFKKFTLGAYETAKVYMIENDYPAVLNMRELPEGDLKAYFNRCDAETARFAAEIPDELPEDFK